jgi:hypothetical protein
VPLAIVVPLSIILSSSARISVQGAPDLSCARAADACCRRAVLSHHDTRRQGGDHARLASGGLIARTNTAAEFGEIIEHERAKVAAIPVRHAGLSASPELLSSVSLGAGAPGLELRSSGLIVGNHKSLPFFIGITPRLAFRPGVMRPSREPKRTPVRAFVLLAFGAHLIAPPVRDLFEGLGSI